MEIQPENMSKNIKDFDLHRAYISYENVIKNCNCIGKRERKGYDDQRTTGTVRA